MDLPQFFKDKIKRTFGKKGEEWLKNIDNIVNGCMNKWNLRNLKLSDMLSYNLILFAESPSYGDVVLKIGVPTNEINTEIKSLTLFDGVHICKLFDYDVTLGALLLERIIPGHDLKIISNNIDRITIAADIIKKLPIPIEQETSLPTYTDWVNKAFARAKQEKIIGDYMLKLIEVGENLFNELNYNEREKVLLHGDLHHENILRGKNNKWKVIDPKGVIGIRCIEVGRFIINEIEEVEENKRLNHIELMISVISNRIKESKKIISICAFLDCLLSTCWHYEDNSELHVKDQAIKKCELILQYIKNL